jgi:hypothetical protein
MRPIVPSVWLVATVSLAGCGGGAEESASQPTPDWRQPAVDLDLPPIRTFAARCARCHGERGAMYAQPFKHQGEALRQVVSEMMRGPAQLDPTDAEIEAMLAYHRTMREAMPFAVATNAGAVAEGSAPTLDGEATPEAMVAVRADGKRSNVKTDGQRWSIDAPTLPAMIEAKKDEAMYHVQVGD